MLMQVDPEMIERSFVNFRMQMVRKQDHEGWLKIAVNLCKKIQYTILNVNHFVY